MDVDRPVEAHEQAPLEDGLGHIDGPELGLRLGVGDPHAALAGLLGGAQRGVGLAERLLAAGCVERGDADAGADREGPLVGAVRQGQGVDDPPGHLLGLGHRAGDQDGELVAAEAGDQVVVPEHVCSRRATSTSSWSPASWPAPSLTALNPSRSSTSRQRCPGSAVAISWKSVARLGRPVRWSV